MKDSTIIILAVIFVVVLAVGGYSAVKVAEQGWQWLTGGDDTGTDIFGTSNGQAGINLKVYGQQGTVQEFSIYPNTFLPMMFPIDTGQGVGGDPEELDRVEADILITPQYTGTMKHYDATLNFDVRVEDLAGNAIWDFGLNTQTMTGGATGWASGVGMAWQASKDPMFNTQTITASQLETAMTGEADARYNLIFELSITLTIEFDEGNTDTANAETRSTYQFQYDTGAGGVIEGAITSLAVTVDSVPLEV